jgi:hypothetical protein
MFSSLLSSRATPDRVRWGEGHREKNPKTMLTVLQTCNLNSFALVWCCAVYVPYVRSLRFSFLFFFVNSSEFQDEAGMLSLGYP